MASECTSDPVNRSIEEITQYDDGVREEYNACKSDQWCGPRRAYCRMQYNPAYPTTHPYGFFNLWQFHPAGGIYMWGYMRNLNQPNPSQHAISINQKTWDSKDCVTGGPHLQYSAGQSHRWQNAPGGHTGDLWPLYTNSVGNDNFWWNWWGW